MERLEELVREQVRQHVHQYHETADVRITKPEILKAIEDHMVSSAIIAIKNAAPPYISATQKELDRSQRIYELTNLISNVKSHVLGYSWVRSIVSLFTC
jgi:hypothetical protein